ncbi:hypothetical protein ACFXDH_18680 [Streptomyces sp. NPDC059467]|uniref:hypothetical protein n=1 Tax=Streptomyces sp. NPDC059467 TaxID=3346844 RepID=UPI0036AE8676
MDPLAARLVATSADGEQCEDDVLKIEINPGSGRSGGPVGQGPLARTLSVALDRNDRGGYCEITVWSTSGALPDDSALPDIAEKVLPRIPERSVR